MAVMKLRILHRIGVLLLLHAVWSIEANAQTSVNEKRPAAPDGVIGIDVLNGTVDVKGWANEELQITGTVTPSDAQLKISGDPRNLRVSLTPQRDARVTSNLEIRVPAGCTVRIKGVKTNIRASGVTGTVAAESVEGDIAVSDTSTVELQAVKGKIDLSGSSRRARLQSVNGGVSVKGGAGEISVSSVDGPIVVSGDAFEHVRLNTVSGQAEFEGKLGATATLSAESVSGTVKLALAGATGADIAVTTMGGKIENGLAGTNSADVSHGPRRSLAFSTGGGGAKVSIQTLSGAVILSRR
jgi:DUF4097 and DUF4098 domain-containing protein YvlB